MLSEMYESFMRKKERKTWIISEQYSLCVAHVACSWCTQYMILSEKKEQSSKVVIEIISPIVLEY